MLCLCFACALRGVLCFSSAAIIGHFVSSARHCPAQTILVFQFFLVFLLYFLCDGILLDTFPLFTTDRGLLRLLSSSFPSASWCFCFVFELVLSSLISFQGVNDYGYFSHILVLLGVLYVSVSVVFYFGSVLQICLALFRTRWNFSLSFYLPNRKLSSTFIFSLFILLRHMNLIYTYTLDLSCPE